MKLYSLNELDKCNIKKVKVYVSEIRFESIDGVYYILEYCLLDKKLIFLDF